MAVEYLCCVHGTLITYDASSNRLRHATGPGVARNAGLMTDDGISSLVCRVGTEWRRLDGLNGLGQIGLAGSGTAPLRFQSRRQPDDLMSLAANGVWLCAEADGAVTLSRQVAGPWETFCPISEPACDFLNEVGGGSWIAGSGDIVDGIGIEPDFRVRVGHLNLPFRTLLDARHRRNGKEWTVVYNNWMIERFIPFRPLIYMIAYGKDEIFETMGLALRSLHEFGGYAGDVLIFSDRNPQQLAAYLPPELSPRTRVAAAPVADVTDMMAIKFRICDMPELAAYRPFLYLDADIICNAPIGGLLVELARAHRIAVTLELDLLGDHNYYGAILFNSDTTAARRHERGFSAGLMGIPSVDVARATFPAILESMYGLARQQTDRAAMSWIFHDQGVANYVLHKTGLVDFEIMTPRVTTPVDFNRPLSEIPRLGFAHFCGGVGNAAMKLPSMRAYMDLLRGKS